MEENIAHAFEHDTAEVSRVRRGARSARTVGVPVFALCVVSVCAVWGLVRPPSQPLEAATDLLNLSHASAAGCHGKSAAVAASRDPPPLCDSLYFTVGWIALKRRYPSWDAPCGGYRREAVLRPAFLADCRAPAAVRAANLALPARAMMWPHPILDFRSPDTGRTAPWPARSSAS